MIDRFRWFKNSGFLWDGEKKIYIDPWGLPDDVPPADAVLITHAHYDHFSPPDITRIRKPETVIWATADTAAGLTGEVNVVSPGDAFEVLGHSVDAVPAYNTRQERVGFHPQEKGWVGYVFAIEGVRYYHAGDTDQIPDMELIDCDVAFLPIGGTVTMDHAEAAEAAKILKPKMVVPMHYGFVAGSRHDAKRFADIVAPLKVVAFEPEVPFEH